MSRVKITALKSVHIGNGNFLQKGTDFVVGDDIICVIDPKKVLDIIGTEKIDNWVAAIERREDMVKFLKRIGRNTSPEDYASRTIAFYEDDSAKINKCTTLKECIHDGRGYPYIPGTSIKGAIRTAILASVINENPRLVKENDLIVGKKISSSEIEKNIFGGIQNSMFKYLRIGDAFFDKESVVAVELANLNIRERSDDLNDNSKKQVVEVIEQDSEAECNIVFAKDNYEFAKRRDSSIKDLYPQMDSLSSIFSSVNAHTKKLVEEEIDFWKKISETKDGTEKYIREMGYIIEDIDACRPGKECILRLGHTSGWRFITGAWSEQYPWFDSKVVPAARPGNDKKYSEYPFPKSRRIAPDSEPDSDSEILGFIKLSLLE